MGSNWFSLVQQTRILDSGNLKELTEHQQIGTCVYALSVFLFVTTLLLTLKIVLRINLLKLEIIIKTGFTKKGNKVMLVKNLF